MEMREKFFYRLGDGWNIGGTGIKNRPIYKRTLEEYPNTILSEYLKSARKKHDVKLMSQIINEYVKKNNIQCNDNWNFHIRLGDVIDNSKHSVDAHFNKSLPSEGDGLGGRFYIEPREYFLKKIKKAKKTLKLESVTLYSSYHGLCKSNKKTIDYLKKVIDLFNDNGIKVTKQINNLDIDLDFVKLCKSKYFTNTNGGFSRLVTRMVNYYNNCII